MIATVFSRHPSHKSIRGVLRTRRRAAIRLGSQTPSISVIQINSVEAIKNSSNKLVMKDIFREAEVTSPNHWKLSIDGLVDDTPYTEVELSYPILAKRSFRSRGVGMKKLNNRQEFLTFIETYVIGKPMQERNPYYLEKFHNYSREYRLHVSEFGCFYACRKMLRQGATDNRWYRNDSNSVWITERNLVLEGEEVVSYDGENLTFNKPTTWNLIVEDCQRARVALGLDICCFDVKVNREGEWIILESNSAPSFGIVTTKLYKEELQKILDSKNQMINV